MKTELETLAKQRKVMDNIHHAFEAYHRFVAKYTPMGGKTPDEVKFERVFDGFGAPMGWKISATYYADMSEEAKNQQNTTFVTLFTSYKTTTEKIVWGSSTEKRL